MHRIQMHRIQMYITQIYRIQMHEIVIIKYKAYNTKSLIQMHKRKLIQCIEYNTWNNWNTMCRIQCVEEN
jgi:hypothetical protein